MHHSLWIHSATAGALLLGLTPTPLFAANDELNCRPSGADPAHLPQRDGNPFEADAGQRVTPPAFRLAGTFEATEVALDPLAYLVSEKYDGVRALWTGSQMITRGGLVIQAPKWFLEQLPCVPLDGELWMGRGRFAEVSGVVRRLQPDPEDWWEISYLVFDLPGMDAPFIERHRALQALIQNTTGTEKHGGSDGGAKHRGPARVVDQQPVSGQAALMQRLNEVVAAGGEGLMLARADAGYRNGRSDALLKLKPYQEGEARVIAQLPGKGKYQGLMGSLLVELPDGNRFRVGTGFSDRERAEPPPIGSLISFSHHGHTKNGLPRFASFLRIEEAL